MRDEVHAGVTRERLGQPDATPVRAVDADGHLQAAQPTGSVSDLPPVLQELAPPVLARLRAALQSLPARELRFELAGEGADGLSLRLLKSDGAGGDYRLEWRGAGEQDHYRQRLEQRLAFERLIAALSTELIHSPDEQLDALIEQALGQIGQLFDVDRAYVFRFNGARTAQSNTHEWVASDVSREAAHLQDVPIDHFPWLLAQLRAGSEVHVPVVAELGDEARTEREEFEREGIRSLVLVPFGETGDPEGFIGFDSVHSERNWPVDILVGLRLVSQMFLNAFRAKQMRERLSAMAFHDPLTGMGNRRYLNDRLVRAIDRADRDGDTLAVVLIDLDDFKLVNDSYGHSLGDEVLRSVGTRLATAVRASDVVARLGGDEFVVVASTSGVESLAQLVDRLFDAMRDPVVLRGVSFSPRMSVGIALFPDDGRDAEALLRQADAAMYAAKGEGKHRFAFFTPRMTQDSRNALRLRHDLGLAVARGEIRPHYQPRVALPSGKVLGFEALARWHHPDDGVLMPGSFLGLARQAGLLGRIDRDMLAHALDDLAGWRTLDPTCRMSVNLDAADLHDDALLRGLQEQLEAAGEIAGMVELEVTESSLMQDIERAAGALGRLRRAIPHLRLAIDDFGSGYSSLAYLGQLPVTTLKIDRGFTAGLLGADPRGARAIMRSIIQLGGELGLHVVAEGVETRQQADILIELGCQEAQGFLYSAAVDSAAATAMLERNRRR
ncbi:putative bifunctional diguanylate cyclase/phosphodiesterase [Lysobacter sp. A3-1-A15]